MSLYAFATGLTAVTFFLTGLYVYIQDTRRLLYQRCFIFSAAVAFWAFGYFITLLEIPPYEVNLAASRLSHAFGAFIPITYLHFVWAILRRKPRKKLFLWSYLFAAFMFFMSLTPLVVKELLPKMGFSHYPEWGLLYPVYSLFFVAYPGYAQYEMAVEIMRTKGTERMRLIYFFVALALAFSGGISLFLLIFNVQFPPYLSVLIILYPPMMAYTIFVYRFMDIEVVVKKTVVFAILFAAVSGVLAFVLIFGADFLQQKFGGSIRWWLIIAAAAIIVFTVRKLDTFLIDVTDRFLFRKKLDYRKVLKAASTGLSRVNSLRYQLKLITYFLTRRGRIKTAAVYMPEGENGENGKSDFILKEFRSFDASQFGHDRLAFDSQIVTYLKKEKKKPYLEFYETDGLARKHKRDSANLYRYDFVEMMGQMNQLRAHLVVPSYYQDRLQGILVLGEKRSEEPYTEEDISLFQTVAQETAIAFENARKHDKLVAQKEELAKANEKLKEAQAEIIQAKEEAAVAELSGGISHDVNNGIYAQSDANERIEEALNNLSAVFKELYDSNHPISASQKVELFQSLEDAMVAVKQSEEAGKHIEDVARTLSQIAKGERAQMSRLNLRTFISGMVRIGALRTYSNRLRAQAFEEEPEVVMPNDLPSIRGHAQLLKGVFINLFKNAIDAMNNISPKKLKIEAMQDPKDQDMVRIEFSDNGCGISKEHLPHIFDYEFTTKGQHGEGKGLFNLKSIIENEHKGKVEVESELGKGTTFILKIPIWKAGVHDL